jgi:indolepyruvate ferredoxin oxidoreductase beta subunit
MSSTVLPDRTLTLLIGALGGEGGGVLTDWVVKAAESMHFPTQATSIPGVAQRTGATTYYVEIYPMRHDDLGGRSPVMALYPAPDNMDVVVTSELMEAGRMLENGMVTSDRTTLIASSHRVYSIIERSAMGDGLFDDTDLRSAATKLAKRAILSDMDAIAKRHGTVINAVLLGVLAGSEELPIPAEAFERAIESVGVAVDANLRGFRAGLAHVRGDGEMAEVVGEAPAAKNPGQPGIGELSAEVERVFPPETAEIIGAGVRRVVDFQNPAYGAAYLAKLQGVLEADRANGGAGRGFKLTTETGRYLALWMAYEDIIRVAELKSRTERMARVRAEVGAKSGEPVVVTEFLKPGWEEISSVLPPALGRKLMNWASRTPGRRDFHFAMRVKTNTVFGFARLWLLAKFRWWRPRTYRFAEEQAEAGAWLDAIVAAAPRDYDLALEIAELPSLRKGYSDTHRRGVSNYRWIMGSLVVPAAAGEIDAKAAADAVAKARGAALADPDGNALQTTMAEISHPTAPVPEALDAEPPRATAAE